MPHDWVPYVWSCAYGSRDHRNLFSAESAVNHHEADVEMTSPLSQGAVLKVNYCHVKDVTLSAVKEKVFLNGNC